MTRTPGNPSLPTVFEYRQQRTAASLYSAHQTNTSTYRSTSQPRRKPRCVMRQPDGRRMSGHRSRITLTTCSIVLSAVASGRPFLDYNGSQTRIWRCRENPTSRGYRLTNWRNAARRCQRYNACSNRISLIRLTQTNHNGCNHANRSRVNHHSDCRPRERFERRAKRIEPERIRPDCTSGPRGTSRHNQQAPTRYSLFHAVESRCP